MLKRTEKDMRPIRRTLPFDKAIKKKIRFVTLKNYKLNGKPISLAWDFNRVATRDKVFRMTIGDQEAYIDLEELLSYTRLM